MAPMNPYDKDSDYVRYTFWENLTEAHEQSNMNKLALVGKATSVLARFTCELALRNLGSPNEGTRIILAELVSGIERLAALRGELNRFHIEEEQSHDKS